MIFRLGPARTWRVVLGLLALLSFAAAVPLSVLSDQVANLVIAAAIGVPSAGIGVLVTRRQPGNPLGWLFLVSAVCQFIGTCGGGYALLAYHFGHHLPLLLATQVLKFHGTVAVAGATLVAAALFNPVRRRVQHAVDRRFNRARYGAERMVTAFAARLQDTVDPDAVRSDLVGVVHTALEPTHLSVWLGH